MGNHLTCCVFTAGGSPLPSASRTPTADLEERVSALERERHSRRREKHMRRVVRQLRDHVRRRVSTSTEEGDAATAVSTEDVRKGVEAYVTMFRDMDPDSISCAATAYIDSLALSGRLRSSVLVSPRRE